MSRALDTALAEVARLAPQDLVPDPMHIPARALCAKLLPHTTAVENVAMIAAALWAAEESGFKRGLRGRQRLGPDNGPCGLPEGLSGALAGQGGLA